MAIPTGVVTLPRTGRDGIYTTGSVVPFRYFNLGAENGDRGLGLVRIVGVSYRLSRTPLE